MQRAWPRSPPHAEAQPFSSLRFHPVMSPGSCFWFPPGVRTGCFAILCGYSESLTMRR